jgi:tripartite-type tricarboxylate transporter receptor subunit TctC
MVHRNLSAETSTRTTISRRRALALGVSGGLFGLSSGWLVGPSPAHAQAYPSKPIRFIVPYPPGGGTDVVARIMLEPLMAAIGGNIIIDNRSGAAGSIGTDVVAKATADGYTLLFTLSSHTINPGLYSKLAFDTEQDFVPISQVASLPQILVANNDAPFKTLADLIAAAKLKPGSVNFGSVGAGSPGHIAGELLDLKAGTKMQHIPYRGGGPAMIDLLGGTIPVLWVSIPAAAQQVKAGKVKALAVSTKGRSSMFPNLPTVAEQGFPDFEVDSWFAMFAPTGTPRDLVDRWNKAVVGVLNMPDIREKLLQQGAEAVGSSPEQLDTIVRAEIIKWTAVIRQANIKPD